MKANAPRSLLLTVVLSVVVIVGVLIAAVVLRPPAEGLSSGDAGTANSGSRVDCGAQACQVLVSENVGDSTVDLLADTGGDHGKVRVSANGAVQVFETTITTMGVRMDRNSLSCEAGPLPACLIKGPYQAGTVGEILVSRAGNWRSGDKPYFSDAGSIALSNIMGDAAPEIVRVRHDCATQGISVATCQVKPVYVEVLDLSGKQLGCTKKYTSPSQIRGWPDIKILANEIKSCS